MKKKPIGNVKQMKLDLTKPFAIKADMELQNLMILVGANATGKSFVLINTWCLAYIVTSAAMIASGVPGPSLEENVQFVYDHSFVDHELHGTVSAEFDSGVKITIEFRDGKVEKAKIEGMDGNFQPATPIFMSTNMRLFSSIGGYLKLRKRILNGRDPKSEPKVGMEMIAELLKEGFKLYDVSYIEGLIQKMPTSVPDQVGKIMLEDLQVLPKALDDSVREKAKIVAMTPTQFDVDLEKCDFFLQLGPYKRQYLSTMSNGQQAMINMVLARL